MYEVTQKVLEMSMSEFKTFEVPKGWVMKHLSGEERLWGPLEGRQFAVRIIIEKNS